MSKTLSHHQQSRYSKLLPIPLKCDDGRYLGNTKKRFVKAGGSHRRGSMSIYI